jgi:glycosyltransferase involved in cell wall biosynthesis
MFTLCIPTMDRFDSFLSNYLPRYLNNILIGEIVITDENGNDATKIKNAFPNNEKIKIFVNQNRVGPFLNKLKACSHASNEWIVLMDSDNFASDDYFVKAAEYISAVIGEQKNVILAPSFASPRFDYSHLNGFVYEKGRFQSNKLLEQQNIKSNNSNSETMMNTGNYVLNKYLIDNVDLSKEIDNIKYSSACDVIYFNTMLFEQLDLKLHVVPNMIYDHVVHNGSIYMQTHGQFCNFNDYVHQRYHNLQ